MSYCYNLDKLLEISKRQTSFGTNLGKVRVKFTPTSA